MYAEEGFAIWPGKGRKEELWERHGQMRGLQCRTLNSSGKRLLWPKRMARNDQLISRIGVSGGIALVLAVGTMNIASEGFCSSQPEAYEQNAKRYSCLIIHNWKYSFTNSARCQGFPSQIRLVHLWCRLWCFGAIKCKSCHLHVYYKRKKWSIGSG